LIVAGWLALRLAAGPVSVSFLLPTIESALSRPDQGFTVHLKDTVLVWSRDTRMLEIRAMEGRLIDHDGRVVAAVPELSVVLSGAMLVQGVISPTTVRLVHPTLHLGQDEQGGLQFGVGDTPKAEEAPESVIEDFLALLVEPSSAEGWPRQLRELDVVGGDLTIDYRALQTGWHAPRVDLRLVNDGHTVSGHARFLLDAEGAPAKLDIDAAYQPDHRLVSASVTGDRLQPALFAMLAPDLAPLTSLRLPISGTVALGYQLGQGLTEVRADLTGGSGVVDASSTSVAWRFPVDKVALRASYVASSQHLAVDRLQIDMGGAVLAATGGVDFIGGDMRLEASGRADNVAIDSLPNLWPESWAPNPRAWVVKNMAHGHLKIAEVRFAAHVPAGLSWSDLVVDQLAGKIAGEGMTVQYLVPMPPVHDVATQGEFDSDHFHFHVTGGQVAGLSIAEGDVVLRGMMKPEQVGDIDAKIAGPMADALRIVDGKPLGWAHRLGIDSATADGKMAARLVLSFPLISALTFDQMAVHADVQTSDLGLPHVALGLDLSEGAFAIAVDKTGLDLTGKGRIGGIPADITWRENFAPASFRSRYQIDSVLSDEARKTVGLDAVPFQPPYVAGDVATYLIATTAPDGRTDLDIKADMTRAAMRLPNLNWRKAVGVPGEAHAGLVLSGNRITAIPRFTVTADNGLSVGGQAQFVDGGLSKVTFDQVRWTHTDITASIGVRPDKAGLALELNGPEFDAGELVGGDESAPTAEPPKSDAIVAHKRPDDLLPLSIRANVGHVWLAGGVSATNVAASLERDNRDWRSMRIDARIGDNQTFRAEIVQSGAAERAFKLSSSDAGSVFRGLGVFDNIVGGQLAVKGTFDDQDPSQTFTGLAKVTDYYVVGAPLLARLLTVASLTGIADEMSGRGIAFSRLEAPFTYADGVIALQDFRAYGNSIGITARGKIDIDNNQLALEGTIVPIYILNGVLNDVPVVGPLLSPEKGGGILAMSYSVSGSAGDPSIRVNPLLAPGVLRNLLNIFSRPDNPESATATPAKPAGPTPGGSAPAPAGR
jgi:hypothetical protein